jgi:octanoyl-[GcvH]:protein N-octanoyltransferase
MQLVRGGAGGSAALEVATSHALLRRVAAGALPATLRLYCPPPTVAFGKLDTLRPGYAAATEAARAHGFAPVVRLPGGHAAAYHRESLGIDVVYALADPVPGTHDRFRDAGHRIATALMSLGVDARVGEVPGEFCPGAFSVNARGRVKLAGTAQRLVRGGALLGASIVVDDGASVTAVVRDVYAALGIEWDPATSGAVEEEAPAVDVGIVGDAVAAAFEWDGEGELDAETLALARALEPGHVTSLTR